MNLAILPPKFVFVQCVETVPYRRGSFHLCHPCLVFCFCGVGAGFVSMNIHLMIGMIVKVRIILHVGTCIF